MIQAVALTQLAFLSLGIAALKIIIHVDTRAGVSPYLQVLDQIIFWLYLVPLVWMAFASICLRTDKPPLTPLVARATGGLLAVLFFLLLASIAFLPAS